MACGSPSWAKTNIFKATNAHVETWSKSRFWIPGWALIGPLQKPGVPTSKVQTTNSRAPDCGCVACRVSGFVQIDFKEINLKRKKNCSGPTVWQDWATYVQTTHSWSSSKKMELVVYPNAPRAQTSALAIRLTSWSLWSQWSNAHLAACWPPMVASEMDVSLRKP